MVVHALMGNLTVAIEMHARVTASDIANLAPTDENLQWHELLNRYLDELVKMPPETREQLLNSDREASKFMGQLNRGEAEEALEVASTMVERRLEILGVEHVRTALALEWQANALSALGRQIEAIDVYLAAIVGLKQQLGPTHSTPIRVIVRLVKSS